MAEQKFPSNSVKSRVKTEKPEAKSVPSKRKHAPVVTGGVTTKKSAKGSMNKLVSMFVSEDVDNLKDYVILDVVVPTVKKTLVDALDIMLNGSTGRGGRSRGRVSDPFGTQYRNFFDKAPTSRISNVTNAPTANANSRTRSGYGYSFDDIILADRGEAEYVIDCLCDIVDEYHLVTVSELYELINLETTDYTAPKWGWTTNIHKAKVVPVRNGYLLQLPRAMPID